MKGRRISFFVTHGVFDDPRETVISEIRRCSCSDSAEHEVSLKAYPDTNRTANSGPYSAMHGVRKRLLSGQTEIIAIRKQKRTMPRFEVTIAGEVNRDLILYGVPQDLPRERERLADRMMPTLGGSSAILAHNLAALGSRWFFQSPIADHNFEDIALHLLQQPGVDVSCLRRTHRCGEDGHYYHFAARAMAQHCGVCGNNRRAYPE